MKQLLIWVLIFIVNSTYGLDKRQLNARLNFAFGFDNSLRVHLDPGQTFNSNEMIKVSVFSKKRFNNNELLDGLIYGFLYNGDVSPFFYTKSSYKNFIRLLDLLSSSARRTSGFTR